MKKTIQAAAVALLLVSWLFPYFVYYSSSGHRGSDLGFDFLFSRSNSSRRVDFARLFLTDLCIVALAAGALHLSRKE